MLSDVFLPEKREFEVAAAMRACGLIKRYIQADGDTCNDERWSGFISQSYFHEVQRLAGFLFDRSASAQSLVQIVRAMSDCVFADARKEWKLDWVGEYSLSTWDMEELCERYEPSTEGWNFDDEEVAKEFHPILGDVENFLSAVARTKETVSLAVRQRLTSQNLQTFFTSATGEVYCFEKHFWRSDEAHDVVLSGEIEFEGGRRAVTVCSDDLSNSLIGRDAPVYGRVANSLEGPVEPLEATKGRPRLDNEWAALAFRAQVELTKATEPYSQRKLAQKLQDFGEKQLGFRLSESALTKRIQGDETIQQHPNYQAQTPSKDRN